MPDTSIKELVQLAFKIRDDAKQARDALAKHLPTIIGPDFAVCHRLHTVLTDLEVGLGHLQNQVTELKEIGRFGI